MGNKKPKQEIKETVTSKESGSESSSKKSGTTIPKFD